MKTGEQVFYVLMSFMFLLLTLSKVRDTLLGLLLTLRFAVPYRVLLLTLSKVRDNGLRFGRGVKK